MRSKICLALLINAQNHFDGSAKYKQRRKMPTRLALRLALFVLSLCCTSMAQQTPTQTPTFATKTEYVQVPVIVQKSGKHLTGLSKTDFIIQQDGKDQPIA